MCYVGMNEDIVNPLLARNFQRIYRSHYYKCPTKISKSQVSHSKDHLLYLEHCSTVSRKAKIIAMDKGKNIQIELTKEQLRRKIKWVTQEIQEAKEEGLRVDMATAIYKAATVTLDEDMAAQMKRKKDVETETDDLREKLDMLRLKVQEREAIEARIESKTTSLLAKIMSLDKELTVEMEEFTSMRERDDHTEKEEQSLP